MNNDNIPLIDEKFIQSIWDKLQMSNWIVNQTSDLPKDIKKRNIIYIVHCSVWDKNNNPSEEDPNKAAEEDSTEETLEKYDFLKIGISKNGHIRLSTHLRGKNGVLNETHISNDDDFKKFIKEDDHKEFIKKYCLIQFYRFNDEENKIIAKMDNDYDRKELEKELKKWQDYWEDPKDSHGIAGPVEYVEKPIESLLKNQRLLKYPDYKKYR